MGCQKDSCNRAGKTVQEQAIRACLGGEVETGADQRHGSACEQETVSSLNQHN